MNEVRVLVAAGFGINCQEEMAAAWQMAGAAPEIVHLNDLFTGNRLLEEFRVFCLPGGFSFGDDLGSGKVLANRLRFRRLPDGRRFFDHLAGFIDRGGFVLGICNGFQVLVKLGLLPNLGGTFEQEVSLATNDSGRFEDRWVRLSAGRWSRERHPWLEGLETLDLPVRHGEGKLVTRDPAIRLALDAEGLVLWHYADENGDPTDTYPANPNGSELQAAGLSDRRGRVWGLMPHPEAFLEAFLHPDRSGLPKHSPPGLPSLRERKGPLEVPHPGAGRAVPDGRPAPPPFPPSWGSSPQVAAAGQGLLLFRRLVEKIHSEPMAPNPGSGPSGNPNPHPHREVSP